MAKKKEYRSSLRSKRLIREALMTLLQEKDYEKITVTDIVKLADINRATFYAHYQDVMALMEEINNEMLSEIYKLLEEFDYNTFFTDPHPIISQVVAFLAADAEFYQILLKSSGALQFLEELKNLFEQYMQAIENVPVNIKESSFYKIRVCYFSGGMVHVLKKWIVGELQCTQDEIVEHICLLLMQEQTSDSL